VRTGGWQDAFIAPTSCVFRGSGYIVGFPQSGSGVTRISAARGRPTMKVMQPTLDIPHRLAEAMSDLGARGPREHCIAVVLPLREGMREVAAEFLAEGPPFDPKELGLARHEVFLGDSEVIFVFETQGGLATLEHVLSEPDFWSLASSWEHLTDGEPRVASAAFEWQRCGN
jgi:hypothetical protein